jgi:predicted enzyme related to lactoylglutathione lyase
VSLKAQTENLVCQAEPALTPETPKRKPKLQESNNDDTARRLAVSLWYQAALHLQHAHLFASDIDATIDFYKKWFDAEVMWDGDVAGARNVFRKIGIGALHFYDQLPRGAGKNAVHHLGMQVVGINELYERMTAADLHIPNPIRPLEGGGGYFMLGAPDGVVIEVFESGKLREPVMRKYFGFVGRPSLDSLAKLVATHVGARGMLGRDTRHSGTPLSYRAASTASPAVIVHKSSLLC